MNKQFIDKADMGTQSKFKILIIDDDPSNLENMDSALLKKGYEVKSESQDLIRAMMNENPSGQLIVDKKGMIRFANRAAEDIMCSANTTLTGKQFLHSLDKGEKKEIILFDQDKNERIAEVHAVEVMYEGEKMSLIFFNEITQKKRLQAVISDYGKRNARAQTLGKIGHWEYNYLTKEFRASDETLKICNIEVKKSKLELKDFVARIAHRKLTLESFTRLAKKYNDFSYIFEIENPEDDSVKSIITRVETEKDEHRNLLKVNGVVMDITERQMALQAARESESKFQEIFNSTHEAIFIHDALSMEMVDLNDRAVEMYGYISKNEMQAAGFEDVFAGQEHYSVDNLLSKYKKASKKGSVSFDWFARRKNGPAFWAEVSLKYALLNNKECFISVVRDVSARKKAEMEIVALKEDLEKKVISRTKELSKQVEKLDKSQKAMLYMVEDLNEMTDELRRERKNLKIANEELESFSYSVSHDLRAPLRAINGFSGILMENYAGSLGSDGARICKIINDSTLKMGRLIDDLLAFSRLNRTEIVRTSIDMTRLAQDVYLELTSPEQRQAINWKSGQLCHAEGDLALMRQVWINLIANAIKFSSKNSSPAIEINCRRLNGECEYCIRDNGVGFDMRYADKLFGVFQRLHTENEFEGTGVGLAIVNNIITRHGGWIKAEGKVDSGAAFYFSLPV